MEILAPAGSPDALAAALDAGADAVYFGLRQFNARRGATNFLPAALADIVAQVHRHGARAYLTLNIDLAQRELAQAARHLELARQAGVDAVLVRDAALLALRPFFPEIEFHLSTQAGVSSAAGMAAARALGCSRVVLARELTLAEIRAAAAVPGIAAEVFVQGALCFCVSGRCLLSSWGGGRSGNRGTCASPCRVLWRRDGAEPVRHLAMHDLCLVERLPALAEAGVRALKIEGRLKTAAWVGQAVRLYRRALAGTASAAELRAEADRLGAYTGRRLTVGFIDGLFQGLTGEAGRPGGPDARESADSATAAGEDGAGETAAANPARFRLRIGPDGRGGLEWELCAGETTLTRRTPHQPVRHRAHSVTLAEAAQRLVAALPRAAGLPPLRLDLAEPDFRVPRSTANAFVREALAFLRRTGREPDGQVRIDLPVELRQHLVPGAPHPANCRTLGDRPDRVRLAAASALAAGTGAWAGLTVTVEGLRPAEFARLAERGAGRWRLAVPAVFHEAETPALQELLAAAAAAGITVEINSWDGWELARAAGVGLEAGPGLMVLNAGAARELARLGCAAVTVSLEADRGQVEDLCAAADVPLVLQVYGRPPVFQARADVELPPDGAVFRDQRGIELFARREGQGELTVFRPLAPFSWCDLRNPAVRVAHLEVDLVGAADPGAEWQRLACPPERPPLRFNYARTLR
jgi:putative protease